MCSWMMGRRSHGIGSLILLGFILSSSPLSSGPCLAQESLDQFRPHDIVLHSPESYENPYMDVQVSGRFQGPTGQVLNIPGFHDGGNSWKIRFSAPVPGTWTYSTTSTDSTHQGFESTGTFTVRPNTNSRIHGGLRVDPQYPRHFVFEDGTDYFLMGYEIDWLWAMDVGDHDIPEIRALLNQVKQYEFNHITMNLYAHDTVWSEGHQNEWDYGPPSIFPWAGSNANPDHSRMNPAFFQHYDRVMNALLDEGMMAHVLVKVYNKMVNWPNLFSEEDDMFWHYVVARYQAYPNVLWDTGKESFNIERYDLGYSIDRNEFIRQHDAYDRLITTHDPDNHDVDNAADYKADQIHYNRYQDALLNYQNFARPYINIEYGYEEGVDDLPTYGVQQRWEDVLERSWVITMGGAYINYYYSNTAWDLIKPNPEPPGYGCYALYYRFWTDVNYRTLDPSPQSVLGDDSVLCRARAGGEYVFYTLSGHMNIRLEEITGSLQGYWLHTRTGQTQAIEALANGDHTLQSPFGSDSVLHLGRSGAPEIITASVTPDPYTQGSNLEIRAEITDPDGLEDITYVFVHAVDPEGRYRGYVQLEDQDGDGVFLKAFEDLQGLAIGTYTLAIVAYDSGSARDVFAPLRFESR